MEAPFAPFVKVLVAIFVVVCRFFFEEKEGLLNPRYPKLLFSLSPSLLNRREKFFFEGCGESEHFYSLSLTLHPRERESNFCEC